MNHLTDLCTARGMDLKATRRALHVKSPEGCPVAAAHRLGGHMGWSVWAYDAPPTCVTTRQAAVEYIYTALLAGR